MADTTTADAAYRRLQEAKQALKNAEESLGHSQGAGYGQGGDPLKPYRDALDEAQAAYDAEIGAARAAELAGEGPPVTGQTEVSVLPNENGFLQGGNGGDTGAAAPPTTTPPPEQPLGINQGPAAEPFEAPNTYSEDLYESDFFQNYATSPVAATNAYGTVSSQLTTPQAGVQNARGIVDQYTNPDGTLRPNAMSAAYGDQNFSNLGEASRQANAMFDPSSLGLGLDPNMDAYYENASRKANQRLAASQAGRGMLASSATMGMSRELEQNLAADQALRESQYRIARAGALTNAATAKGGLARNEDLGALEKSKERRDWAEGVSEEDRQWVDTIGKLGLDADKTNIEALKTLSDAAASSDDRQAARMALVRGMAADATQADLVANSILYEQLRANGNDLRGFLVSMFGQLTENELNALAAEWQAILGGDTNKVNMTSAQANKDEAAFNAFLESAGSMGGGMNIGSMFSSGFGGGGGSSAPAGGAYPQGTGSGTTWGPY